MLARYSASYSVQHPFESGFLASRQTKVQQCLAQVYCHSAAKFGSGIQAVKRSTLATAFADFDPSVTSLWLTRKMRFLATDCSLWMNSCSKLLVSARYFSPTSSSLVQLFDSIAPLY